MEKLNINLHGVPQTLLLPLLGRALLTQKPNPLIHDGYAVNLVNSLNYDFNHLLTSIGEFIICWEIAGRAYYFDKLIKKYLQTHPRGIIVNLGAGLETEFYRVDNGQLTWIDLDLPEVINLRKKLFPPEARVHLIEKSILDFSWMDEVKRYGHEFLFLAAGLFIYFKENEVKNIFATMAQQFKNSELIFTASGKNLVHRANKLLNDAHMEGAKMQWALTNLKEIKNFSPHIQILSSYARFETIKTLPIVPWHLRLKMHLLDLWRNFAPIVHVKFI